MYARARRSSGVLLLLLLIMQGCSTVSLQSERLLQSDAISLPTRIELEQVPFYPQVEYQCGPAALATILGWSGIDVKPDELVPEVYIPERKGSLQPEMLAAARKRGVIPYPLEVDGEAAMEGMLRELAAGSPVLVMQNLGLSWVPQWHYAVVVGYDLDRNEIVLRSGQIERHVNSFQRFERTWRRSGYWGAVLLPPERMPASISLLQFARSAAILESLGRFTTAQLAYKTGLYRWPEDRTLLMGLANSSYALKEFGEAEQSYRRVVELWPGYAPGLNNLAYLLYEKGRYKEAEPFAIRAVSADERGSNQYKETLAVIRAAMIQE